MSRQQRRNNERIDAKRLERRVRFEKIHGQVLAGRTVLDIWKIYWNALSEKDEMLRNPAVEAFVRQAFYAGAGAMLELMTRVGPDTVTEDQGVEMLTRLHEELETFSRGLR